MSFTVGLDNSKVKASLAITIRASSEGLKVIILSEEEVGKRKQASNLHSS
jgi:hypothetical protein